MTDQPNSNPETPQAPSPAAQPAAPQVAAPAAAVAEDRISIDYFSKIKLRVAQILTAEPVPKSKKLLRLEVDAGPVVGKRQILAGVAQHYAPETLIGRKIVIIANLEPAKLMGLESQGMLLASSNDDGSGLVIVNPGDSAVPGSTVR
jgi:methionyl-tRNA synthetase